MRFLYSSPEAAGDQRHLHYWKLFDAALASNQDRYGNYTLVAYHKPLTFQRAAAEVKSGNGWVNVVSRATNLALERRLRPIRIGLDKGLLGARLFLVMLETQVRLEKIRTLDDLKQFSIG